MKTTRDLKAFDNVNGYRVFVSNIAGLKTQVSVVKGVDAKNKNQGDLVFQQTYTVWNRVPDSDVVAVGEVVCG